MLKFSRFLLTLTIGAAVIVAILANNFYGESVSEYYLLVISPRHEQPNFMGGKDVVEERLSSVERCNDYADDDEALWKEMKHVEEIRDLCRGELRKIENSTNVADTLNKIIYGTRLHDQYILVHAVHARGFKEGEVLRVLKENALERDIPSCLEKYHIYATTRTIY